MIKITRPKDKEARNAVRESPTLACALPASVLNMLFIVVETVSDVDFNAVAIKEEKLHLPYNSNFSVVSATLLNLLPQLKGLILEIMIGYRYPYPAPTSLPH